MVPLVLRWLDVFRLALEPEEIESGQSYRLDVVEPDLVDLAGNPLGDSLASYSFSTLDKDSLGSVTGKIEIALTDRQRNAVLLTFNRVADQRTFEYTVTDHQFDIPLPPAEVPGRCCRGSGRRWAADQRHGPSVSTFRDVSAAS